LQLLSETSAWACLLEITLRKFPGHGEKLHGIRSRPPQDSPQFLRLHACFVDVMTCFAVIRPGALFALTRG
jgi:hypothetical protein